MRNKCKNQHLLYISNMTTSLRAINSQKAEPKHKFEDYVNMIKTPTPENVELKETNEKCEIALESLNKQQ